MRIMINEGPGITPADIADALHHAVQLPHVDPETVEVLLATGMVSEPFRLLYRGEAGALGALIGERRDVIPDRCRRLPPADQGGRKRRGTNGPPTLGARR
jgi:hypothetical protein